MPSRILSGYRLMWVMVMFDLPVVDSEDRKAATRFRLFLEKQGFGMCQFSVYAKYCGTREKLDSIVRLVDENIPEKGKVNILSFTDKQFGKIVFLENRKRKKAKENPDQLLIFDDPNE